MTAEYKLRQRYVIADFAQNIFSSMSWNYEHCLERKKVLQKEVDENLGEVDDTLAREIFDNDCRLDCYEKMFDYLSKM